MNNNNSVRNNQAFSKEYSDRTNFVLNTISEWAYRKYSKLSILNYIIKNIVCYGDNSHPSQTTIGRKSNVKRGWVNIVTNELVALGLITKTRVIIDGDEQACEYALTPFLKDVNISWMLKDILPSLKLLYIFSKKEVGLQTDNTPYIDIYFKKNYKIVRTRNKSISRKQKSKINKMQQQNIQKQHRYYQTRDELYVQRQILIDEQYQKEKEEKLIAASQDENVVNFIQGLLHGRI